MFVLIPSHTLSYPRIPSQPQRNPHTRDGCISADLLDKFGDGAHEVVFGENFVAALAHLHEYGGALVAQEMRDTLDGGVARDLRQGFAHDFADDQLAEVFPLESHVEDLVFVNGADDVVFFEYR